VGVRRFVHPGGTALGGGARVTPQSAAGGGPDGYAADASACVKKAKALLQERRTKVPA
jgi:5-methyltetrahydrofolate--homocysteine methyltransferase